MIRANETYASKIKEIIASKEPKSFLNAVFYGRVSTDNESQKDSCDNQLQMALNYIKMHPAIVLVEKYIDDGISGKSLDNRPKFMAMLGRISEGDIDLIIVKSMSRLHRNETTALYLQDLLVENKATILTLEDNQIHDFEDGDSMIIHSVTNAIDAQYVRRQSKYGKMTHQLRCERKELSAKDISYGYSWNKESKTISINEEEKENIIHIFELYVYKRLKPQEIAKRLKEEGIYNHETNARFCQRTIIHFLDDERYIGKFYINKKGSTLGINGESRRFYLPKSEWVLVERPDLKIVDEDLFELAHRLRESSINVYMKHDREMTRSYFQGKHLFSCKVFCGDCYQSYRHSFADRNKTKDVYVNYGSKYCVNQINKISEKFLCMLSKEAIHRTLESKQETIDRVKRALITSVGNKKKNTNEIKRNEKQIEKFKRNISGYSVALSDPEVLSNQVAKRTLLEKIKEESTRIEKLESEIQLLKESEKNQISIDDEIQRISQALDELKNVKKLDRERIKTFIDKILLYDDGHIDVILKTGNIYVSSQQNLKMRNQDMTAASVPDMLIQQPT